MTTEEIFNELLLHMTYGVKLHDQFATIYDFLNLKGYKKCHEYHCFEEHYNCRKLKNFYMKNYNKILLEEDNKFDSIIPQSWHKYTKSEVDSSTKRSSIKDMMKKWVDWEQETKILLSKSYKELYDLGEICAASMIQYFLNDVFEELAAAQEQHIDLESHGYDLSVIIPEQELLYKKFRKKLKQIYEDDE